MAKTKVIAVANQKSGVGKSASVFNPGVGLALSGKKVLPVDVDPQGDLTKMLGQRKPHEMREGNACQQRVYHHAQPRVHGKDRACQADEYL